MFISASVFFISFTLKQMFTVIEIGVLTLLIPHVDDDSAKKE